MGRGYSAHCTAQHKEVRSMYRNRVSEIGDMASYVTKDYFEQYLHEKTGYSKVRIRQILNMKQKEITQRESQEE